MMTPNPSSADPVVLSAATPQLSASKFKATEFPTLICYQNEWMSWDGAAYQGLEAETVEAHLSAFMGNAKTATYEEVTDPETGDDRRAVKLTPFNPKSRDINDVYKMLKHLCHVPIGTMDPPSWLKGTPTQYAKLLPKNLISFQNGLLDIETRVLHPATPFFFTRTALQMNYDPNAPEPTLWLEFMRQVTKDRQPLIELTQEMLGYLISTDTSMHKIFFLWGRPRSGKGTILRITTALVGEKNMRYPSIETLAGRFGMHNLIGGSVAQITDANTMDNRDLGKCGSRMNGISGEDGQTVERKGIGDWNGKISVRFQIAGNTLPNFGTNTVAMATRLLIIPFDETFEGREDRALTDKLIAELPGILNWALVGLDRLRLMGDFVEPNDSKVAKKRLVHLSDPIHGFVEDYCVLKGGAGVDRDVLYGAYVRFCEGNHVKAKGLGEFTEGLQAIHSSVLTGRRRKGNEAQVHCYRNITLNDEIAEKVYQVDRDESDDLGVGVLITIKRDVSGWPVPRATGGDFAP
ncbi:MULTISPECIES: DNA primase family protein [Bradyrhizobium]|uniref:DNA primase/helicase n=2 Tax=Bradyrhizobium TaxID=374 RepID=A0ABY0PK86_9BRAD|nr:MULTISPECIES: phage/plasmid primase, P4 family [Bradyrhizobium]SDI55429.1 putative DNA primase/helicase [Bradyrhizobium ottawaense]SED42042.1 putative DNA primase/helicase [Bradyrhizobium lablabi]